MIHLLKNRRSIRKFKDEKIDENLLKTFFKAVLTSPAGHNINHIEYIYVDDDELLKKLSDVKAHGAMFLKDAPQAIIVTADESKTDVWIEDASIAATVIQLTAESLGMGSCWIQMRLRKDKEGVLSEKLVKEIMGIEENRRVECIIAFGYPAESRNPHDISEDELKGIMYNSSNKKLFL